MRHTTLLLALAALATTSCSLQLDSQYGLRWDLKTHVGPSNERIQKSSAATEKGTPDPVGASWAMGESEGTESVYTTSNENPTGDFQQSELNSKPTVDPQIHDALQFDPEPVQRAEMERQTIDITRDSARAAPNPVAVVGAVLLILAGIFGLIVVVVALIIMAAYGAPSSLVATTLGILLLSILFFWIATKLLKISNKT